MASALALAPLVAPSISLSALTGTGAGVAVRIEPLPLRGRAAGLVVLAAGGWPPSSSLARGGVL